MSEFKQHNGGNNDEPVHTSTDSNEGQLDAATQQAWRSSMDDVPGSFVASTCISAESKSPLSNALTEDLIVMLNQMRSHLLSWLSIKFPRVPAEDLIQEALLKLWTKGPTILSLCPGEDASHGEEPDNGESESSFRSLLIRRFKRMLYCRAIDYARRQTTVVNGGNYIHIDIENLKDSIQACSGIISVTECAEALTGLTEWLRGRLTSREEIVAKIYLRHLPERSSVDEIYEEISHEDRLEFLPRNGRTLSDEAARGAVQSQISRSRSSFEGKLREFGKTQ